MAAAVPIIKSVALFIASVVATVLLFEAGLQIVDYPPESFSPWVADSVTGFRLAPNLHQRMTNPDYDVEIRTNSDGFRDDPTREKHGLRILLLGDSFTFGYGVERGAIFADLLEQRLGAEIINSACGGFEIIHQVRWLRDSGARYQPDLVLYALYLGNDLVGNVDWIETSDGGLTNPKGLLPLGAERSIKIVKLLESWREGSRTGRGRGRDWTPHQQYLAISKRHLDADSKHRYAVAENLLKELAVEVDAIGADLIVATFPFKTVVDPRALARIVKRQPRFNQVYDLERPSRIIRNLLAQHKIQFVDLLPPMKRHYALYPDEPLFFHTDGHFTSRGHEFVAHHLERVLSEWLRKRSDGRRALPVVTRPELST